MRVMLTLLLIASPVLAAPPKVPTGPVLVKVGGQPQVVTVEVPAGTEFATAPAFAPEDCLLFPGETDKSGVKKYLVMPYKPGVYRVIMWTKGETEYSTLIIDASGTPTPGPSPVPVPVPVPTPSGLGMKEVSKDGLAKVADKATASQLANAQRAFASKVAAGAYTTPAAILAGWKASNNSVVQLDQLPAFQNNWKPWATDVSAKLSELYSGGKLPNNLVWASAFNEMADGLEGK